MIKFLKKNRILIFILLLASFCRLYRIADYMEFLGDQGRDVVIIRDFLKNGNLFFIGPQTSIGNMYLGPYYYYLIAPSLLLANFNPIGPSIFVALLGVATVWLIYYSSAQWFNRNIGLIAAFLYSISPVVIKYSNFSWNPNVMPFFALLFIYCLSQKKYIFAVLAFIMALNSHYLALILLPIAALIWIYNFQTYPQHRQFYLKSTLIALFIFLISLTPQILFDLKHQGQNYKALQTFFTQRETTVNLKAYKSLPILPSLFNQINTRLLAGKNNNFGIFISLSFFVGLLLIFVRQFKINKKINPHLLIIFLWYLIGLIGLGLYKQHIYDHYFAFLFPPVFILMAYIIYYSGKYIGPFLIILITILSLLENPLRWPAPHQLRTTQAINQSIIDASSTEPFNFALLAKMNYDPGYKYFFYENNSPLYNLQDKITDQLFVVCEPHPDINCNPINHPEWGIAAFGWAKIDRQWQIDGITIYRLIHTQKKAD